MNIDKGVPIPEPIKRTAQYPFSLMEIGDSIFVAGQSGGGLAGNCARITGRRKGMKFTIRKVEGGIRIWRKE